MSKRILIAWSGTFSMVETGSHETSTTSNGITITEVEEFQSQFDGYVDTSQESGGSPATGWSVQSDASAQRV